MPSSTSSSDELRQIRHIPNHPWRPIGVMVVLVTLLVMTAWELRVRAMGYAPTIGDTPELWAMSRDQLKRHPDSVTIVGSSRIRFGLDHDVVSDSFAGARVVNLSMNGSVAAPVLADLAADESFAGIVLCGYTPGLFWAPGGPLFEKTKEWVGARDKRTPSARLDQWLALAPESVFAFANKEALSLSPLLERAVELPNREGTQLPPRYPPYFSRNRIDRRNIMWSRMETDTGFQEELKDIWQGLFVMARSLPPDLLEMVRGGIVDSVGRIRARGGEVIFIAFPATGWLHEYESEQFPRETYWKPLIAETGSIGIHFEDYPELSGYDCPEWSHLTEADALQFSKDVMRIIAEKRAAR